VRSGIKCTVLYALFSLELAYGDASLVSRVHVPWAHSVGCGVWGMMNGVYGVWSQRVGSMGIWGRE
jgi:hypothetical protein